MKKSFIAKIVEIILIIILIVGCISLIFVPELYDMFKYTNVKTFMNQTLIYRITFYSCYVIGLYIIYKMIKLFNIVYEGSPFKKELENILKVMAVMFMLLFLIVIIKSIFIPNLLSFVVAIICFIASLSFYVLAEVIKSAIKYKNEVVFTV